MTVEISAFSGININTNNSLNTLAEHPWYDWSDMTLNNVMNMFASLAIIFGGIIPYVPQYLEIRSTENVEGFSTFVCFVLLLSNTMRIIFRFGQYFVNSLVIQSIVMIVAMFAMMELCVRVKNRSMIVQHVQRANRYFLDFDLKHFWQWTDFLSYIECIATIAIAAGITMYFFLDNNIFVQGIGYIALVTEASLGMPQLIRNYRHKSTKGMSHVMVLLWLVGDVFKTTFFIWKKTTIQFWVCGFIQVAIDVLILLQILYYAKMNYRRFDRENK